MPGRRAKHLLSVLALAAALTGAGATARGAILIDVGTHRIEPAEGQEIPIQVTGGDPVEGLNFYAQIGDATEGPVFDCDLETLMADSLFDGGLSFDGYVMLRRLYVGMITSPGVKIQAEGLLATITVDATGLEAGSYPLLLSNDVEEGRTDFAGIEATITDGWIQVVPEPASAALLAAGAVLPVRARRRRTRRRRV